MVKRNDGAKSKQDWSEGQLVSTTALRHLWAHILRVQSLKDGILDSGKDGSESIDTKDHIQMLVVLQFDRVDHLDVLLVTLNTLDQWLAEYEEVNVTIEDRVGREGSREPRLGDARVEDASTVGES